MSDVTVLVASRGTGETLGDPLSNIDVVWNPEPVELPDAARDFLEDRWTFYEAEARAKNKTLFNGPITQLRDARRLANGRVQLTLGPSDYKTFLVTCIHRRPWFETRYPQVIARALGNSALLTHGDEMLLGIRSQKVSAYAGLAHVFGGVLELLNTEKFPATVGGIIAHLRAELAEEVRINAADLEEEPRLLFVAQDNFLGQPEAVWHWRTRTSLDEIAQRLDPVEHSGVLKLKPRSMLPWIYDSMTPEAREAWRIWSE